MDHHGLGPDHQVRVELDRILTRLTSLGPARLSRPGADGAPSAAGLVREVLQPLADAVADAARVVRRAVPVLADRAVPDQLAVLGADALAPGLHRDGHPAAHAAADDPAARSLLDDVLPDPALPDPALPDDVLADLAGRLAALRRALP